ncbi:MAG: methylenetetrahydrofolate reductase [Candidatus Sumerlaeota bacterium]|nr:methylenetetrahydrofolate reductase [Candidatus Sumerlaeota bacterium]
MESVIRNPQSEISNLKSQIQSAAGQTRFAEKIRAGEFVITCELIPPKAPDFAPLIKRCALLRGHVDAINVTDCPSAVLRMAPLPACHCILGQGLEVILQSTCRDRNRLSLQADLIGAYAMGVRHVMALSGDYIHLGDHPSAKPVFDFDSVNYLMMLAQMKQGRFYSGEEIRLSQKSPVIPMDFTLGAAANPFGLELKIGAMHLMKKVEAGAEFFQTQPVFDVARFREWAQALHKAGLFSKAKVLIGVMPARSAKALSFMKNEVPGMSVPDDVIKRFEAASDPKAEGVTFAKEVIDVALATPGVAGIHFMPVGWEEVVPELVAYCCERRTGAGAD